MKRSLPAPFYSLLPDTTQTLLLKACLFENGVARDYWQKWVDANSFSDIQTSNSILPQAFDRLDFGSQRLLPLVYKKLSSNTQDPLLQSLKGYYRYNWVRNHMLRNELSELTRHLGTSGIGFVIIKGFPIVEAFYKDLGARPVIDLDIALDQNDWIKAVSLLKTNGWIDESGHTSKIQNTVGHATPMSKGQIEIDLHFRFLHAPVQGEAEKLFWSGVRPYMPGHPMLRPEHQLICTFTHGYQTGESSIRSVADACYIIRNSTIDWKIVVSHATLAKLAIPCLVFMEYLVEETLIEIPRDAIQGLGASAGMQRNYFRIVASPPPRSLLAELKLKIYQASALPVSMAKKAGLIINTYKLLLGTSFLGLVWKFLKVSVQRSFRPN